jgi:hypothetical protein
LRSIAADVGAGHGGVADDEVESAPSGPKGVLARRDRSQGTPATTRARASGGRASHNGDSGLPVRAPPLAKPSQDGPIEEPIIF